MEPNGSRRVIEESLGDAMVKAIDDFVFHDIEDETNAVAVFDFVGDPEVRAMLGAALRGVRWQQKVGLVLARYRAHPAHAAQTRSQMIEYGAIAEMSLHEVVRQERPTGVPATFQGLIARAQASGILDEAGAKAANDLREARNCVHLNLTTRSPATRDGRKAFKNFIVVINQCRAHAGLAAWKPVQPATAARPAPA